MGLLLVAATVLAALNIVRIAVQAPPLDVLGLLLNVPVVIGAPVLLWVARDER